MNRYQAIDTLNDLIKQQQGKIKKMRTNRHLQVTDREMFAAQMEQELAALKIGAEAIKVTLEGIAL